MNALQDSRIDAIVSVNVVVSKKNTTIVPEAIILSVGPAGTFSSSNDLGLSLRVGPTHPSRVAVLVQRDGRTFRLLWLPARPDSPTISCWGVMLHREGLLAGTGVPGVVPILSSVLHKLSSTFR